MAFQRIWGLMARHRRKIILTGVVVGGGYAVYNWKRSAIGNASGGGNKKGPKFFHKQEVSDKLVKAFVADGASAETRSMLSDKHNAHFRISEISKEAQQGSDQGRKMAALQSLTNEIFARALSSVFVLCALVVTHRVELNIFGRRMDGLQGADGDAVASSDDPAFTAFVETARYVSEDAGLGRVAEAARAGMQKIVAEAKLTPKTKVSANELVQHFSDACAHVFSELGPRCAEALLPGSVEAAEARPLLQEARNVVASPPFLEVFRAVVAAVAGLVVADLASNGKGGPGPLGGDGVAVPLGKLLGRMTEISNAVLGAEAAGENGHIERAAGVPALQDFCESLYFQEPVR